MVALGCFLVMDEICHDDIRRPAVNFTNSWMILLFSVMAGQLSPITLVSSVVRLLLEGERLAACREIIQFAQTDKIVSSRQLSAGIRLLESAFIKGGIYWRNEAQHSLSVSIGEYVFLSLT